ncbi:hypothetical protein DFQ28_001813 [Apophysomyces sp. BC1034]|nr:hypothetical protein DFQ30_002412 [Apophysomyces sp. BC1015]KAG0180761.1 hypothetical protein DFQ29_010202 [Apophysomyces sp. BC1021]KAG0190606.1 hypothetical protein DFQ28_001813 [Apophysomyces sp. BC1034]
MDSTDNFSRTTLASHSIEKTVVAQGETETTYPHLLECSPFPALTSIGEITQTLTRTQSQRTCYSKNDIEKQTLGEEVNEDISKPTGFEPYGTEGIRNPGWIVVVSTFMVNFFVFGTVFSWGNFQRLYVEDVYKGETDAFRIAFVGTSATACLLSCGLFITPLIQRLGFRGTMLIGTVLAPLGLILASFATQLWHIYLSQGILFGIGGTFVFAPSVALPSQWFVANRALATGIAVSGSGIGGLAISPMSQHLIASVGYRNALRAIGGMGFGILLIATALAKSRWRPPPSASSVFSSMIDLSLIDTRFSILLLFGFIVPFGYVGPFFLAPTYGPAIGMSIASAAALVSIMSAMNAVSRVTLGFFADYVGRLNTMFLATFLAGIFTMVIWQLSSSYEVYTAYAVLYGLTGGGFVSLFPVVVADIVGLANVQRGLGMCYLSTTVGTLLGTPIVGLLQQQYGWTAAIQCTGAPTVVSALVLLVLRFITSGGKIFAKV